MGEGRVLTRSRCCVSLEPQHQQQQLPGATDDEMMRCYCIALCCRLHAVGTTAVHIYPLPVTVCMGVCVTPPVWVCVAGKGAVEGGRGWVRFLSSVNRLDAVKQSDHRQHFAVRKLRCSDRSLFLLLLLFLRRVGHAQLLPLHMS